MEKENLTVPYTVFEGEMARAERHIKRLWILLIVVISLLVGTNGLWIWYESQFEDEVITQEVETGKGDAYVSGIGDVYYGESKADN